MQEFKGLAIYLPANWKFNLGIANVEMNRLTPAWDGLSFICHAGFHHASTETGGEPGEPYHGGQWMAHAFSDFSYDLAI